MGLESFYLGVKMAIFSSRGSAPQPHPACGPQTDPQTPELGPSGPKTSCLGGQYTVAVRAPGSGGPPASAVARARPDGLAALGVLAHAHGSRPRLAVSAVVSRVRSAVQQLTARLTES